MSQMISREVGVGLEFSDGVFILQMVKSCLVREMVLLKV